MASDSSLLVELRGRGAVTPQEEALLRSPEVLALSPRAQLDYLVSNRRVGRGVTLFAGGLRLMFLTGALAAHVVMVLAGSTPFAWWALLVWLGLAGLLAWWVPAFVRRVRELSRPLPSFEELGLDGR